MTYKNAKTILFASLIAAMILPFSGMMMADAAPNENANDKAKELAEQKILKDKKFDEVGKSILKLQLKNQALEKVSKNDKVRNENARDIELLFAELDKIDPPTPTKKIPPGLEKKMNEAIMKLVESDLPLYAMGISSETGLLDVKVDSSKATNIDDKIQAFVGKEIPLNIEYGINKSALQAGSCNQSTGLCAPLIGGSDGKDKYYGQPCTVSIAVVRDVWFGADENGIIIPDHCNRNDSDYYQANTGLSSHKVGSKTKDGGLFCDCDFIKSDSRTIDTSKITIGSSDYSTSGNADIADERIVFLYGSVSGFDAGRVKEVNQWWYVPSPVNKWFNNLYKIDSISFTDGDSGAPVIDYYNGKYGGMNIGTDGTYQMVHDWTFLKSELGLK